MSAEKSNGASVEQSQFADKTSEQTLTERLEQIRSQPKLQSQQQTAVVLSAVEDTLRDQKSEFTPTAYFAALLSLLHQYVSSTAGIINKDVATAVVYLLDLVTPHVPTPILRSKFGAILQSLAPALGHAQAEAPFLRSAIGCLVSLLVVQDSQAWALPQSQIGPRKALSGLLSLALDHRPKVRKRAQDGLVTVLQTAVPGPSVDHPAADMCAETALRTFEQLASASGHIKRSSIKRDAYQHEPELIHNMQLIKAIAVASKGWPSKNLESLCEVLFAVARSSSNFLTMTAFEVFEAIFEGMADESASSKLPQLLEAVFELQPNQNDSQLVPPWIAIISRALDVSAQIEPDDTFQKLPAYTEKISAFLASSSYNVRVSAAECIVSFLVNCVPSSVLLEPSIYDEKTLEKIGSTINGLMSVKYQSAWMEAFTIVAAAFESLRWASWPMMAKSLAAIGELRASDAFAGKEQADSVISKAITAVGPENVLSVLPLNIGSTKPGAQGRAWMIPLIRDSVQSTNLTHFRKELVPLSEKLFSRVMAADQNKKTMEIKIFETLVQQIWSCLPGYCVRPTDVESAFDQSFAEMLSNILYEQPEMRLTVCKALQNLVESFKDILSLDEEEEDLVAQSRISRQKASESIDYLSTMSSNLLAVLFNVYSETLPQKRGSVLACIDAYLSITSPGEIVETFDRVAFMLDEKLKEASAEPTPKGKIEQKPNAPPPISHALMDLVVAIAIYLPREHFQSLFSIALTIVSQQREPQLQKKAYKLIPRLAQSESGRAAIVDRSAQLQQMLLQNAENTLNPARKDRLSALAVVVETLPPSDLYFIPSILPEVILGTKETNERARETAFETIIQMGQKMSAGGTVDNSKVAHMPDGAPPTSANIEEYFMMLSAGLAGSTPHMISASVTAISRALFTFKSSLSEQTINDMVQTMDLFLQSPTREVVRSVLGFIKVCVISLPKALMMPRLNSLIPNLMTWSHEHKAHFRVKVKNILERMIRHYGYDAVERNCPVEDKKLIINIRKTRERSKRKRKGGAADGSAGADDDESDDAQGDKPQKFANEFDEAIYGSEDDSSDAGSEDDGDVKMRSSSKSAKRGGKHQDTYIHEDDDEPLDLLGRNALAKISSTKPGKGQKQPTRHKAQYDEDGKLVLREDDKKRKQSQKKEIDEDMVDAQAEGAQSLEGGIDAYVQAIRGRDAPKKARGGRIKFTNKRSNDDDDDEDMDDDAGRKSGRGEIPKSPRMGGGKPKFPQRRSLAGRVDKRGGFSGRGRGRS